ncbi:hypothetical protein R7Z48_11875 [Vibrio sp. 1567]|uniref:hypothetical protein n=1 Tax=Vibrio sp. 1567 TaxID=3074564 RepID=UPI0029656B3F|nr:hypothetical protein [Vibrio sp. 1567]MDW2170126.1 hypothetical protein [Vibrio sp. 1567]
MSKKSHLGGKSVTVPFKYCSIERASRFLTEVLDQSIEVEDIQNFLRLGVVRGCVCFSSVFDRASRENIHLVACVEAVEFDNTDEFDNRMEDRLNSFLCSYSKPSYSNDGEFVDGIIPFLWFSDQTISHLLPPIVSEESPLYWRIENEGINGIFIETPAMAAGLWEIQADWVNNAYDLVFSQGEAVHGDLCNIKFGRIPATEYRWHGYIDGYKLKAENIVLLDEDLRSLIKVFSNVINVRLLELPKVNEPVRGDTGKMAVSVDDMNHSRPRARAPSEQLKNILKAMVYIQPELGSECLNEPHALYNKLDCLFASKGIPFPKISSKSLGDYINGASWSPGTTES